MDTLTETIGSINEAALNAITTLQEQVLAFNREVAAAVGRVELPTWLPTPEPVTEMKVDDLVKQAFDYQAQRIAADRQFALGLVEIWTQTARQPATVSSTTK